MPPSRATSKDVKPKIVVDSLTAGFADKTVLRSISMPIEEQRITAIIGPSGCGKSTLIRCLNRMHELVPIARISGRVLMGLVLILALVARRVTRSRYAAGR